MTFRNTKTKKSTTKKYRCVVKPAKTPVEEALAISGVKQTASNKITVTFNKDVSKEVTAENLLIQSDDAAARQIAVKSVTFSADGKSAEVLIFGNFVDGTSYKVTYTTLEGKFPASVGAVASIVINTTEAQQNVATPIDFQLFDANGIDVTPSVSLDAYTSISISGNYATAEITKPSTAKITLDTIGMIASITVTYNANTADSADITASQDIVCVDPKAVSGNTLFTVLDTTSSASSAKINAESGAAKFYQGLSDSTAMIAVSSAPSYVFFCATDENKDAITYDSYEVESSNDNVVSANVVDGLDAKGGKVGKYAIIEANGNSVGNAQLLLTASKNGKRSTYIIPVTTYRAGVATKMTVTNNRTSMSDSDDPDYCTTITAKLYDAADREIEGTFTGTRLTDAVTPASINASGSAVNTKEANFKVTAPDASAKTYTFEIAGSDNVDNSKALTRRVNISVSKLPSELKSVSYQLEVSKSTLDIANTKERETTVRLYATCNGLFAGYVRTGEITTAGVSSIGGRNITNVSTQSIQSVSMSALFGTIVVGSGGNLITGGSIQTNQVDAGSTNDTVRTASGTALGQIIGLNLKSVEDITDGAGSAGPDSKIDARTDGKGDIARLGSYTIKFELTMKDGKTIVPKTAGITVKNSYVQPTVKVLSTKVNDVNNVQNIIAGGNLSTNVDMNNNQSSHASITDLLGASYNSLTAGDVKNDRLTVRYATVKDNVVAGETWLFYVPISATFIQN